MVRKKGEAFALFDQGVPLEEVERRTSLKHRTVRRYHKLWERQPPGPAPEMVTEVVPEVAPAEVVPEVVTVGSLEDGERFKLRDAIYRKEITVRSGAVIATRLLRAHYSAVETPKGRVKLGPGTKVERVK